MDNEIFDYMYSQDIICSIQTAAVCNYRCRMCGHSKYNTGFMSDDIFLTTIDNIKKNNLTKISFTGPWGEPTLDPKWRERITYCIDQGFEVLLATNASKLLKNDIKYLSKSRLHIFRISFCGFDKKSYETVYIRGQFEKLKNTLTIIKNYFTGTNAPKIMINGIVEYSKGQNYIDNTYYFLESLGYDDNEINLTRPTSFGSKIISQECEKLTSSKELIDVCWPLKSTLGIHCNGDISACSCYDSDKKMIIGNIQADSLKDVYCSNRYTTIINSFHKKDLKTLEMCSKCELAYSPIRYKLQPSWNKVNKGIIIIDAYYGYNHRNKHQTSIQNQIVKKMQRMCNGKNSVRFTIDVGKFGDPAPGLQKNFYVIWRYAQDPQAKPHHIYIHAEAHGKTVNIPQYES